METAAGFAKKDQQQGNHHQSYHTCRSPFPLLLPFFCYGKAMPGTIQVSVIGLMDLPPSGRASSTTSSGECLGGPVSLKIAMGKTEYQTGDKGDFSFPVTSLRENLKLTLLDADGNEISQTDVKTMVVVEKRFWDALFPLEGGGCVHLKLQFILNAEEQKRIREMREAVFKKSHGELPNIDLKDSIAENTIRTSGNIITEEGHLAYHLPTYADQRGKGLVASPSKDFPQQPEHHYEQDAIPQSNAKEQASGYQANQNNIHGRNVSVDETMDPQLRSVGSLISNEIRVTSSSPSAIAQEERKVSTSKGSANEKFPASNAKKLISAFESILVQEPRIHVGSTAESWMRRVKRSDSSGAPWPEEINTEKVVTRKMFPKSFATGALPQMKLAPSGLHFVKVQEEEKDTELNISKTSLGNNNEQSMESKNVQNHQKLDPGNKMAVSKFLHATESDSHERTSETSEVIETKEVIKICRSADITKNAEQYPSYDAKAGPPITFQLRHREHEAFEEKTELDSFPKGISFLELEASHGNLDVTASHCFEKEKNMLGYRDNLLHKMNKGNNKMAEGPRAIEIRKDEEASTKDSMISRKVVVAENISSSSMHQGQPKTNIVKPESGISSIRNDAYELATYGISDVKLDMLTYFHPEQCLLGSHGNSVPRHLCITSGSKQLEDIIGGFICIWEPLSLNPQ